MFISKVKSREKEKKKLTWGSRRVKTCLEPLLSLFPPVLFCCCSFCKHNLLVDKKKKQEKNILGARKHG